MLKGCWGEGPTHSPKPRVHANDTIRVCTQQCSNFIGPSTSQNVLVEDFFGDKMGWRQ